MSRRVAMPGADELFRPTAPAKRTKSKAAQEAPQAAQDAAKVPAAGTGRVRHDEKVTVYLSSAELLALEQARLKVRSDLGRNIDRGRLVRAALAVALADLEARGLDSDVGRRLSES